MNTRRTSNRKSADYRKKKSKNTDAEVFVLPPNLLEKLGIKLDKIQSNENSPTDPRITIDLAVNNSENCQQKIDETYDNTNKPCNNESESSILETASLMKESVFLSPTFVSTIANVIPGEMEIASIQTECKNNENPIQELVEHFPLPSSSEQEIINTSVNTAQSEPLRNLHEHDKSFVEMKDACEYHNTPNTSDETNNVHGQEIQEFMNTESQNNSLKPNENQEIRRNKINILNDEIIDITKVNKLLNFDNNNVLTPVTVGMIIPPTKGYTNIFGSNEFMKPESGCNQSDGEHTNLDIEKCESSCEYIKHDVDVGDMGNLTTESKKNTVSNVTSVHNYLDSIQDHDSQDCPVFAQSVISSEVSNDIQQEVSTDFGIESQIFQEAYTINEENHNTLLDKKVVDSCNEFRNSKTNEYGCDVENHSTSANVLLCNGNDTRNDFENGTRKYKLGKQGVEKPGGQRKSKHSIVKVYSNRQKLNKPEKDTRKQTLDKVHKISKPEINHHENTQVINFEKDSKNISNFSTKMSEETDNQINDIVIDTACKSVEYCLCSDYGQLKNYDEDSLYEHIHFWQHKNVACEPDSIFSIYVDNIATNKYDGDTVVEILNETPEEISYKICWNEMNDIKEEVHLNSNEEDNQNLILTQNVSVISEIKQNNKGHNSIDVEMSETDNNNIIEKYYEGAKLEDRTSPNISCTSNSLRIKENATKDQDANKTGHANKFGHSNKERDANTVGDVHIKTRKKRKPSVRVTKEEEESTLDDTEPLSKRDVKCGVCGNILAKRDWEEHSDKEHGFIAWKAGEIFDVEDKKVFIKIKQKLKDDGVLKCTFCNLKINYCVEYLSHIKVCIKNKKPCGSHLNTSNTIMEPNKKRLSKLVKCGVCEHDVEGSNWIVHIRQEHNYIAWERGEPPLEVSDKSRVLKHLRNVVIEYGALVCCKCNADREYGIKSLKSFLKHIKSCNGVKDNCNKGDSSAKTKIETASTLTHSVEEKTITCDDSPKKLVMNTVTTSLEQKSMGCESPKKINIESGLTLTSPVKEKSLKHGPHETIDSNIVSVFTPSRNENTVNHGHSHENTDISTEITSTPSMYGNSPKKMYIDSESPSTPSVQEKSVTREFPMNIDIDITSTSTPLVKEKVVKYENSSKKMCTGSTTNEVTIMCGVCKQELKKSQWIDHIQKAHNYLAWKEGERSLDLEDEGQVWKHLHSISKKCDGLVCVKCGLNRKYVKSYLHHIKQCDGMVNCTEADSSMDQTNNDASTPPEVVKCGDSSQEVNVIVGSNSTPSVYEKTSKKINIDTGTTLIALAKQILVKCGICKQEMENDLWNDHMQKAHDYLAWKEGESSLDFKDENQIWQHLHLISKKFDGLVCSKCGLNRKYVKAYLHHIKQCDGMNMSTEADSSVNVANNDETITTPSKSVNCGHPSQEVNVTGGSILIPSAQEKSATTGYSPKITDIKMETTTTASVKQVAVKCGVCKQEMDDKLWDDHMQKVHNYLAWKEGDNPLNLQNKDEVWQHLYSISKNWDGLVCSKCGLNRKYVKAYLNHIKQCDGMNYSTMADSSINGNINDDYTSTPSEAVKCDNSSEEVNVSSGSILSPSAQEKTANTSYFPKKMDVDMGNTLYHSAEQVAVKCGVCKQEMDEINWDDHMQKVHNYLAWKEGENPLDLQNKDEVWRHLNSISKNCDGLVCSKCGLNRKYVKAYLNHIKQCDGMVDSKADTSKNVDSDIATVQGKYGEFSLKVNTGSTLVSNKAVKCGDIHVKVENDNTTFTSVIESIAVKCGVCNQEMDDSLWNDHIQKEHNYLAWKEGESSLDLEDEEQVWHHLHAISKKCDGLICDKCGLNRKYVKAYLNHIKYCDGTTPNNNSSNFMHTSYKSEVDTSQSEDVDLFVEIKCGVCSETCVNRDWIRHIQSKHNYLAWKEGEPQLNLLDQEAVENHLRSIIKKHGNLYCLICGVERKYGVKSLHKYLIHIETCGKDIDTETEDKIAIVKCGVCEQDIAGAHWIEHIAIKHNYLAWKHGEQPFELSDTDDVKSHFYKLSKQVEAFMCTKCGIRKRYPKLFIEHIETCNATGSFAFPKPINTGMTVCALCSEQMEPKAWQSHAMEKHYNVAWKVGDYPIDLKSSYAIEKFLKEYRQEVGQLVCKVCGISRVSLIGFYAHVITCGKSEKELEEVQSVCEICNKVYVNVYKNQHMAAHREQEYAKERKMMRLEKLKEDNENLTENLDTTGDENSPLGRRRAAVKARNVIEKLKIEEDDSKTCASCGFEATTAKKLAKHKCVVVTFESGSETDDSYESEESIELDDSNLEAEFSEEEDDNTSRKKRNKESIVTAKIPNLPFKYNKLLSYSKQSEEDFFKVHLTDEILFPEWLDCKYEHLEESQITDYLPKVDQSCKIKLDDKWDLFNRFQVKKYGKGCMFVGGTVKCLSWIPPRVNEDDESGNYLAVSCHQDTDTPRFNFDELSTHSAAIQIWDFGTFTNALPKLVLCIAHDYGTVWAMDWCPSGVRDMISSDKKCPRLGLLAVACSNGFVYIFSVPHPCSIVESDKVLLKLKPVAELRISSSSERKPYQATAISWSKQKGHAIVMVGYADGTTALYDLCSTTPLLKCVENGVTILYPYQDRRDHNVCITDVDIWAAASGGSGSALCSASVAGAAARARCGPRLDTHSPATVSRFTPGWPSVLIAPDDTIATQSPNEMDWYGCARRLGPISALCSCQYCSRVLLYSRPLLRYIDAMPPYSDVKKQTVAIIKTSPLAKKRKIENDELAMLVEPLTYDDVVAQYGVEVTVLDINERNSSANNLREPFTERFPLADVTAMAFCTAPRHHRIAAVGLHAGFVILVTV